MNRTTIKVPFEKLSRAIQIGDVHVRLFRRHAEYLEVFQTLYDELRSTNNDETVIVVTGDIAHNKIEISPEMIDVISGFLSSLADIAPTLVIAGNHDCSVNGNRLDSLSPIINNLQHPNLHYLRDSGVYAVADADFAVCSIFGDREDWPTPNNCQSDNCIALFHGPIFNAKTDVGYTITSRHTMIEAFGGFDIVMCGDIHKHQSLQEYSYAEHPAQPHLPAIVYQGSLIQQNFGETVKGHGWVEWDIPNRDFTFFELENDYGYYTLEITDGKVPDYSDMPSNVRLRIFAGDMEQSEIKKLVADIRKKHTIHEVAVSNFRGAKPGIGDIAVDSTLSIYDINYQSKLITEYLHEAMPNISDEVLEKVIKLNKELNEEISTDDLMKKIFWKPKYLKFDNLFTYGEGNYINFETLEGVVGIFAPNASGKTSVAGALCFALYDRTPQTSKAANIMNYRNNTSYCEFSFEINNEVFVIERTGKKNAKGEVKMDVNFYRLNADGTTTSLNGEERRYTNEIIRTYVGSYEDFILTTFSSSAQDGIFVDKGQSDRKDLLSQFMGLTLLDRLFTRASDESKEIAGALKRFKNDDFTQELVNLEALLEKENDVLDEIKVDFENINTSLNDTREKILEETGKKITLPNLPNKTPVVLEHEAAEYLVMMNKTAAKQLEVEEENEKLIDLIDRGNNKLTTDYKETESDYQKWVEFKQQEKTAWGNLKIIQTHIHQLDSALEKTNLYKFDPDCEFCLKNGKHIIQSKKLCEEQSAAAYNDQQINLNAQREAEEGWTAFGDIEERYKKWKEGLQFIEGKQQLLNQNLAWLPKLESNKNSVQKNYDQALRDLATVEQAKDAISHNSVIDAEIGKLNISLENWKQSYKLTQTSINSINARIAVAQSKKQDILKKIAEAEELEGKYEVYDAYLTALCREGLPYKMISDLLPRLEMEVNDMLKEIVQFQLKFEMDGKNVNLRMSYDEERTWPLELASGMERFISSLAIRVALMSISTIPKTNFLIIDEGFGVLSSDYMSTIESLFAAMLVSFQFILVISHIDALKDTAQTQIDIKRDEETGLSNIWAE